MFTLPKLPYGYDALEPHIDARTMEIHHTKHHQTYTDKANAALSGTPFAEKPIEEIIAHLKDVPEDRRQAARNHGGGYINHNIFWTLMSPDGGGDPKGDLLHSLEKTFGSMDSFRTTFTQAAVNHFGSGWAWLVFDKGSLKVLSLPNQDCPITAGQVPLLTIDIWEHAYYLKFQNKRPDYVTAWWNVVNWREVEKRYEQAMG